MDDEASPGIITETVGIYTDESGNMVIFGFLPGMRIRIRSDPLILGLSDPDPLLFSTDPTCNNGYIKLFSSLTKYQPESTNSSYDD